VKGRRRRRRRRIVVATQENINSTNNCVFVRSRVFMAVSTLESSGM
jgi:hypothetical protein